MSLTLIVLAVSRHPWGFRTGHLLEPLGLWHSLSYCVHQCPSRVTACTFKERNNGQSVVERASEDVLMVLRLPQYVRASAAGSLTTQRFQTVRFFFFFFMILVF